MNNEVKITEAKDFVANHSNGETIINSTLRHDEHVEYDKKLLMVSKERLNGIADLKAAGLVIRLGGLGTILSIYERAGDMTAASVNMDAATDGQKDRVTFDSVGVPIPIFHKEWTLNKRQLESSRKVGESISTTQLALATRAVMDSLESCLFNGLPNIFTDGKCVYGYTSHPDRNVVKLSGSGWAVATGRKILDDTKRMLESAYKVNKYGPFIMYVSKDIWLELQMDYTTHAGGMTFKQRIEGFSDISTVKVADMLKPGQVLLVQMTEDVVDLAVAQDVINLEWQTNPMQSIFKVYGVMAPRIKSDKNKSCGIVHGSV